MAHVQFMNGRAHLTVNQFIFEWLQCVVMWWIWILLENITIGTVLTR